MARVVFGSDDPTAGVREGRVARLEGGKGTPILILGAQPDAKVQPKVSSKKLAADDLEGIVQEFKRRASLQMANRARDIMQSWLEPGGQFNIGWEGTAAKNLKVSKHEAKSSQGMMHYVYEDPNKPNWYIRHGLPPGASESNHVTWDRRKKWVKDRGLIYYGKDQSLSEDQKLDWIVQKVWASIYENGTSSWYKQYEWGKHGYFNYPQWFADKARPDLDKLAEEIFEGYFTRSGSYLRGKIDSILISAFSSGRHFKGARDYWGGGKSKVGNHR